MKITMSLVCSVVTLIGTWGVALAADDLSAGRPLVGEIRSLAIAPGNTDAVVELHHDGWLEARGQLLAASVFPELFKAVGRAWTARTVEEGRFAIPEIHDRSQSAVSSDNPFGVLGPGDLVAAGRPRKAWLRRAPISYWIFVGRDASQLEPIAGAQR